MGFAPPIHHHPCVQIPLRFAPVIIPRVPSSSIASPFLLHRYASFSSSCPLSGTVCVFSADFPFFWRNLMVFSWISVRGRCLDRRLPWILAAGGTKRDNQSVTGENSWILNGLWSWFFNLSPVTLLLIEHWWLFRGVFFCLFWLIYDGLPEFDYHCVFRSYN